MDGVFILYRIKPRQSAAAEAIFTVTGDDVELSFRRQDGSITYPLDRWWNINRARKHWLKLINDEYEYRG